MTKKIVLMMIAISFSGIIKSQNIKYPDTKRTDHVDEYFGTKVEDPYRWLEDENSAETKTWIEAQNEVTNNYLSKIPFRQTVKNKLEKLWNYEKMGIPQRFGEWTIYFRNSGMQNQSILYIKDKDGNERILLDPNKLSANGTTSLSDYSVSNDNKYLAYSISKGGSDWNEIFVIDMASGKLLNDHVRWVKFSNIAWQKDGFYYSSYDVADESKALTTKNEYHKIYYHKLGNKKDKLIYSNNKYPLRNYYAVCDEDEKFLFIFESEGTSGNALYLKNLNNKKSEFEKLADGFNFDYSIVKVIDNDIYILTNDGAANNRMMKVSSKNPERCNWTEIIPENQNVLESVSYVNGQFVVKYLEKASHKLYVYNIDGNKIKDIKLSGLGSIGGPVGKKDNPIFYYSFTNYTRPGTIYECNIVNGETKIYFEPKMDFNPDEYTTEQVTYPSKDSTEVTMFITYRKGTKLDGTAPALLYGYGGFNISMTPGFRLTAIPFLDAGGIYAVANLRGGGEYGKEWHEAGTKLKKQNVFDDFIAAAEFLITKDYASPNKIAIQGGSNGGLLVGACMTQRPDLFKVALPAVGVLDMLRFHKFTIGWAWVGDYGSSDNKQEFDYIKKYSPLHNIDDDVEYPATLVTTADHDDRVVPAHSFKFISELQHKHKGNNPVLIRIESMAGHGAGKPTSKQIEEAADVISFMMFNLDMEY